MSLIATPLEAEKAIDDLSAVIARLTDLVEHETALMRVGKVRSAAALEPEKAALAGQLAASGERIKRHARFLRQAAPTRCAALMRAQDALRAVLKKNITVIATAHAVSEGIMRRLSGELARKAAPQVYGASGRTAAANPKYGRPLALSRTL